MIEKRKDVSGVQAYIATCHCGAVRAQAEFDLSKGAGRCNCSICLRVGGTTVIVKPTAFRLVAGEASLREYRKEGSPNARYFCQRCGIHVFGKGHVPEIGGDFVSISVNCIDDIELTEVPIGYSDGRHDNWMAGHRKEPWPVHA